MKGILDWELSTILLYQNYSIAKFKYLIEIKLD